MNNFIPLSIPNLIGNEKKYINDALDNNWVSTGGKFITEFEEKISQYLNVSSACACQSGTAGIHLALKALGIGETHEVIVPTVTFIAAVNPVVYVNATPIFMDCDETLSMDPEKLQSFCEEECTYENETLVNKKSKNIIKAIIVVHVFGNIANMEKIIDIANKYNLKVIEDATEALGSYVTEGRYKNKFAGTIGDIGVYSFNGNKIITTGGGGMVVSNNQKILQKIKYLSTQAKDDEVYFVHNEIGFNYRMTNLQGAMGVAQLENLEHFIEIKTNNFFKYKEEIKNIKGLSLLEFSQNQRPNYWFYSLVLSNSYPLTRDQLIKKLDDNNIQSRPIWKLNHMQKPYINNTAYKMEVCTQKYESIVNIPCSTNLSNEDLLRVVKCLEEGAYES